MRSQCKRKVLSLVLAAALMLGGSTAALASQEPAGLGLGLSTNAAVLPGTVWDLSWGGISLQAGDGDVTITGTYTNSNFGPSYPSNVATVIDAASGYTGTITLQDVTLEVNMRSNLQYYEWAASISISSAGQIVLVGENKVLQTGSTFASCVNISSTEITGDGSLTVLRDGGRNACVFDDVVIDADITTSGMYFNGDNRIEGGEILATDGGIQINGSSSANGSASLEINGGIVTAYGDEYGVAVNYADLTVNVPATFIQGFQDEGSGNRAGIDLANEGNVVINAEVDSQGRVYGLLVGRESKVHITSQGKLTATALESHRVGNYYDGHGVYMTMSASRGDIGLTVDGELTATGADGELGGLGICMAGDYYSQGSNILHVGATGKLVAQAGATQTQPTPGIGVLPSYVDGDYNVPQYVLTRDPGSSVLAYPGEGSVPAYSCAYVYPDLEEYVHIPGFADNDADPQPQTYTVTFNSNGGSSVASQSVESGSKVTRPADPTRSGYSFTGWYKQSSLANRWNFDTDTVAADITLYAGWTGGSGGETPGGETPGGETPGGNGGNGGSGGGSLTSGGGTSSGGGSSRGGSSGGSNTADGNRTASGATTATGTARSRNVGANGVVNASTIQTELGGALAGAGSTATVTTRGASSIAASTLRAMANAAAQAGKTAVLHADTLTADGKAVQGRLYVEPAKLTGLTGDLQLGVYTESARTGAVKSHFARYYGNEIAVISLDQQDSLGAKLQVAARADLSGMDTANLVFYSYSRANNQFTRIPAPNHFVDSSGYLHFYTELGGDIVVSNGALAR